MRPLQLWPKSYIYIMRNHIFILACATVLSAQTIFYQEDFNSGLPASWSLNTSDQSSTTTTLYNRWVVSADYNDVITQVPVDVSYCQWQLGCQNYPIPLIPDQPAAISGAPKSSFLHVSYNPAYDNTCPPATTTFSYLAPTTIFPCFPAVNIFAKLSQAVSIPAGTAPVYLSFFWLCQGGANAYGEVYYSTNGTSWTQLTSRTGSQQLSLQNNWYADTIQLPVSRPATVYIGFRFVNQAGNSHGDPPLGVDEIRIFEPSGPPPSSVSITLSPPVSTVCNGSGLSVSFSTTGTFNSGNSFLVELSDANGSFATPTTIGSGAASPILCLIPSNVLSGSYRLRVRSTSPSATSNDEPINIVSLYGLQCSASPTTAAPNTPITFSLSGTGLPNGPFDITFTPDDGTSPQNSSVSSLPTNIFYTYSTAGNYNPAFTVTHTASGCFTTCNVPITISTASALGGVSWSQARLLPNPSQGAAQLVGLSPGLSVEVFSLCGQRLWTTQSTLDPLTLPKLAPGLYLVKVGPQTIQWLVLD